MIIRLAVKYRTQRRGSGWVEVAGPGDTSPLQIRFSPKCHACERGVAHTVERHNQISDNAKKEAVK